MKTYELILGDSFYKGYNENELNILHKDITKSNLIDSFTKNAFLRTIRENMNLFRSACMGQKIGNNQLKINKWR